ncbi:MAG: hypothetical protein IKF29_00620 [Oceanobacillus sp.]|nr:hypothetical protein [Oceanobacillus sp.]
MGRKLLYDEDNINNAALAIQKKARTNDTFTTADFADMIMKCGESDITWDRTLLDEWDFTKSLTSKMGRTFTIESGAIIENGIKTTSNQARVYCDVDGLITNGYKVDIELDLDTAGFNRNDDVQIFAFYNTGFSNPSLGLKWRNNSTPYFFAPNNREPLYGCSQVKFINKVCVHNKDDGGTEIYGRDMLLTSIVNCEFAQMLNTLMTNSDYVQYRKIYLGSGYSTWSPFNMVYKGLRIYQRT